LTATAPLWPNIRVAYPWVQRAAHLLKNEDQSAGATVQRRLCGLLGAMARHRAAAGELAPALAHFLKVTRSYWPGLFHCYEVPDLPRTNNDLEQFFGAYRSHERRTSGRKGAAPALVLRGPVRIVAAATTRLCPFAAGELAPADLRTWQALRRDLRTRQQRRTLQRRFRHDPSSYLAQLEADFLKLTLPP
jgi:hypothetical protein